MHDGGLGTPLQVIHAADIGCGNNSRPMRFERAQLVLTELFCELPLEYRIGTRGSTAQVFVRNRRQSETESLQQCLDPARQFLRMLEGAWRVKRNRRLVRLKIEKLQVLVSSESRFKNMRDALHR